MHSVDGKSRLAKYLPRFGSDCRSACPQNCADLPTAPGRSAGTCESDLPVSCSKLTPTEEAGEQGLKKHNITATWVMTNYTENCSDVRGGRDGSIIADTDRRHKTQRNNLIL